MKYFEIIDSFSTPNRWYLDDPVTISGIKLDSRLFTEGNKFVGQRTYPDSKEPEPLLIKGKDYGSEAPLNIPVHQGAEPLSFTLGSFEMPVVTERIAEHLEACCGSAIQLVPATITGNIGRFEIVNVLTLLDAVDETHSEISWRVRKNSLGQERKTYGGIGRLVLRAEPIANAAIFRLENWELALIISEKVKDILENLNADGIGYRELTIK